jgi:outer membrane protein assembly factor BamB
LEYRDQPWTFKVIDCVTGNNCFTSASMPAPSYVWNGTTSNRYRFAQIRSHMLLLNFNNMVYAYDLADRKKLWEYNLHGRQPMQIRPRVENQPDGVRLEYQDGWTQNVGRVGVLASTYVCLITRDGLVALDAAKGTVLWTNSNVGPRVKLTGDDNTVFVFESNAEGALISARAIRASDGVEVKIPEISSMSANLGKSAIAGRCLLMLVEKGDKKSMRLYDILTGKDVWSREIEGNAVILQCEDPRFTGYVSSKGEIVLLGVKDGKEVFSGKLDEKKSAKHMDKVDSAILLTDRERFFFVLNRPLDALENTNYYYDQALNRSIRTRRVDGSMYCFDRNTHKRLWFTDEQFDNQQIILDHFRDLPIILAANFRRRINNGVIEENAGNVMAIDKRTGCCLYTSKMMPNVGFNALEVDPRKGVLELVRRDIRIKFTADETKP